MEPKHMFFGFYERLKDQSSEWQEVRKDGAFIVERRNTSDDHRVVVGDFEVFRGPYVHAEIALDALVQSYSSRSNGDPFSHILPDLNDQDVFARVISLVERIALQTADQDNVAHDAQLLQHMCGYFYAFAPF
jgi:hypothetical protein